MSQFFHAFVYNKSKNWFLSRPIKKKNFKIKFWKNSILVKAKHSEKQNTLAYPPVYEKIKSDSDII